MKVKIKSLHLENFGKHSEAVDGKTLDFELGHKTIISGCNRTGKSTIKRAIQYILGCKDENGKEISGIRPHDDNGVDIDGLTTVAEMTICVDGMENTLKRTCFQEKNRQGEYTGKDNLQYFVDDVRKGTKKAYEEFIGKFFPAAVCMSAQEFFSKDTAGRRAMLEVFSKHDTESIISENAEFEPLRAKLNANSTDDLKKTCREKIKAKAKERDAFSAKIEALNGQKTDIDVAELELQKNALNEQIEDVKSKQADISKEFEEQQRASDGILELKFELNDLQRKANAENNKKRLEIQNKLDKANSDYDMYEAYEAGTRSRIKSDTEKELPLLEQRLKEKQELWESVNREQIDEGKYICPTCHRELPKEEKESILSNFEEMKKQRLEFIVAEGEKANQAVKDKKKYIEDSKKEAEKCEKKQEEILKQIEELEKQLSELPDSIDISGLPEVQEIQRKIAEKEQAMNRGNSANGIRKNLQSQLEDLQSQLMEVNSKLDLVKKNVEIDEQIADLHKQQLAKSQEIADAELELDLLKRFERKKAELLESDVNSWFEFIKIRMFERQANSELKDVCIVEVAGESYDRNLNFGSKMLAEIDICRGFQKFYGIELPILLDNSESISDGNLPDLENQLIIFKCTNEQELFIKILG